MEVLVTKTIRAARRTGVGCVTASGGVTCNRCAARANSPRACEREGLRCAWPSSFCTDNAAMIGILAERKLMRRAEATSSAADILPNWELEQGQELAQLNQR